MSKPSPYQFRYYPSFPLMAPVGDQVEGLRSPLLTRMRRDDVPPRTRRLITHVRQSIAKEGLKNPLIVEWFDCDDERNNKNPGWCIRLGSNRAVALIELGELYAPVLLIKPYGVVAPRRNTGIYTIKEFESALTLFTADHPWFHSPILKQYIPKNEWVRLTKEYKDWTIST